MLNKTTLTAIGAALIALGQELQGAEVTEQQAPDPQPKASRRGKATTEPQPHNNAAPAEDLKTEAQLRELIDPLVKSGKGAPIMAKLKELGGTKLADLPPENQPAFVAEVNKLLKEFAKDIEALSI